MIDFNVSEKDNINHRVVTSLLHCDGVYSCAVIEAADLMLTDMPYQVVTSSSLKDYGVFDRTMYCATKLEAMEVFSEETFDFIEWRKSCKDVTDDQLVVFDRMRSVCVNEPVSAEGACEEDKAEESADHLRTPFISIKEIHSDELPADNGLWQVLMNRVKEKEQAERESGIESVIAAAKSPESEEVDPQSLNKTILVGLQSMFREADKQPEGQAFVFGFPVNNAA